MTAKYLKNVYYLVCHPTVIQWRYITSVFYEKNIIFIFNAYLIITHLTYVTLTQLKQALQTEEKMYV